MKRHKHNLSNYHLFTGDMGTLIPAQCVEVLPGDTFDGSSSLLVRADPLVAPVMHPVQVRIHHWFVPNRILWDGWEDWIVNSNNTQAPPLLTVSGSAPPGGLPDYLGLQPTKDYAGVNAFPFRAYNKIYNDFYRDNQLISEVALDNTGLRYCAWEKDFTSTARLNPQEGDDIFVPVVNDAPGVEPGEVAVADLREAFALQRYAEARSRYGKRYTEYLQYLGIKPSDARLQRPEYLGGGRQTISFSEVLQTYGGPEDDGTNPLGKLGGHGIVALRSNRFRKFFEEHGWLMTLVSVRPKAIYVAPRAKKWNRALKEDYYQKELEHIGQAEVTKGEIWGDGTAADLETFGYQDRYYEYRQELSRVSGYFRNPTSQDWHFGRNFTAHPELNESYIRCQPTKAPFADSNNHVLKFMANNQLRARRMVKRSAKPKVL